MKAHVRHVDDLSDEELQRSVILSIETLAERWGKPVREVLLEMIEQHPEIMVFRTNMPIDENAN